MSGHARRSVVVAVAALIAGCGAEDETVRVPPPANTPLRGSLDRPAAQAEARSAASQAASPQDVSLPTGAFSTECSAPRGASRSSSWRCTVRSRDGRCRGTVELVVAADGTVTARRQSVRCRG